MLHFPPNYFFLPEEHGTNASKPLQPLGLTQQRLYTQCYTGVTF